MSQIFYLSNANGFPPGYRECEAACCVYIHSLTAGRVSLQPVCSLCVPRAACT